MLSDLRYRLRALHRRNAVEAELDDELRSIGKPECRRRKRRAVRGSPSAE
jgi:hypothetical protein